MSDLLDKHLSQAACLEATSLKQFKKQLKDVEADIHMERQQLGSEQADLLARTVSPALPCAAPVAWL